MKQLLALLQEVRWLTVFALMIALVSLGTLVFVGLPEVASYWALIGLFLLKLGDRE